MKWHNGEVHDLCYIELLLWAGHEVRIWEQRHAYGASVEKPEGERQHGKPWRRLEDNIKMDRKEVGWAWTVGEGVMNLRVS